MWGILMGMFGNVPASEQMKIKPINEAYDSGSYGGKTQTRQSKIELLNFSDKEVDNYNQI